jgi:hypothetical protein
MAVIPDRAVVTVDYRRRRRLKGFGQLGVFNLYALRNCLPEFQLQVFQGLGVSLLQVPDH